MSDVHAVARDQLRAFIERIERLEEEKKTIADDIKDVKAEAKGCGFDVATINAIIKLRKQDKAQRDEAQHLLDTYMAALGMIDQHGFFDEEPRHCAPIDRNARAAHRTSEAMDDAKALSAEAAALGLIDPAAHAETARIADAIARKYGAGVIEREENETKSGGLVSPSFPELATRSADESVVLNPPEKVRNEPAAAAEVAGDYLREPVAAEQGQIIREGDAPRETGRRGGGDASCSDTEFQVGGNVPNSTAARNDAGKQGVTAGETATNSPETASECAAPEKDAAADERDVEATVGQRSSAPIPDHIPAFLTTAVNERCLKQGNCRYDRHPQKITCSDCTAAWETKKGEVA